VDDRFDDVSFGSSGIRGPYGEHVDPTLALALGQATATLADDVIVGRDPRTTSSSLEQAFVAGATAGGARVRSLGVAATPLVGYGAREADVGVIVTASHNPAADNGFKFFSEDGSAIDDSRRKRLLSALRGLPELPGWEEATEVAQAPGVVDGYKRAIIDEVGPLSGDPRIVVDPGHGAASHLSPQLLRDAGARPLTVNATPDGTFPGRPSEPRPEHLEHLSAVTEATDAIAGIAHDGDADRLVAVDENGRMLQGDHVIVLLARSLRADAIAVPIDTSRLVWEALEDVDIEVTPVGDTYISERVERTHGDFGGEASGAMIFPGVSLTPDGPHAAVRLAQIADRHDGLADLVDEMPSYATVRESLDCPETAKQPAMAQIQDELEAVGDTTSLDGVRVDTDDGWALVRPSGTEPKLRITAEADTDTEARGVFNLVEGIARQSVAEVAR
jgi:phosphoglucosamine mutase